MQTLSFGLTMPAYCIVSLLTGPRLLDSPSPQPQIESSSIRALRILPWSMTLCYIIPTILMCSRSFSGTLHQYLLAFWQPFPIWVALFQIIFSMGTSGSLLSNHPVELSSLRSSRTTVPHPLLWISPKSSFLQYQPLVKANSSRIATIRALAYATNFASYCAAFLHWVTIFLLLIAKFVSSLTTALGISGLSIIKTFMPANPFSPVQIRAMPQGVLVFLQYDFYIGTLAALIWTAFRHQELEVLKASESSKGAQWLPTIFALSVNVICFGPGATVVSYSYLREAELELMSMRRLESIEGQE
jgi:hypothetical protein